MGMRTLGFRCRALVVASVCAHRPVQIGPPSVRTQSPVGCHMAGTVEGAWGCLITHTRPPRTAHWRRLPPFLHTAMGGVHFRVRVQSTSQR